MCNVYVVCVQCMCSVCSVCVVCAVYVCMCSVCSVCVVCVQCMCVIAKRVLSSGCSDMLFSVPYLENIAPRCDISHAIKSLIISDSHMNTTQRHSSINNWKTLSKNSTSSNIIQNH